MNKLFGLMIGLLGLCIIGCGLYFGLWVCFVGGIVDIIDQFKAPETSSTTIAVAILKICITSLVTTISFVVGVVVSVLGFMSIKPKKIKRRRILGRRIWQM